MIVATMGGSGSSALQKALHQQNLIVLDKPDTLYRAILPELRIGELNLEQGFWSERSHDLGTFFPQSPSLTAMSLIEASAFHTLPVVIVSNTFAELGVWSDLKVPNIVFLVRHPLHAYLSWCKAERHGDIALAQGGPQNEELAARFVRRWNAIVTEYLRLRGAQLSPSLIRFEYAREDIALLKYDDFDFLARVGNYWRSDLRNFGDDYDSLTNFFREATEQYYGYLYPAWNI